MSNYFAISIHACDSSRTRTFVILEPKNVFKEHDKYLNIRKFHSFLIQRTVVTLWANALPRLPSLSNDSLMLWKSQVTMLISL